MYGKGKIYNRVSWMRCTLYNIHKNIKIKKKSLHFGQKWCNIFIRRTFVRGIKTCSERCFSRSILLHRHNS